MKDRNDLKTSDMLGRKPGRPRIYANDAEKQRAYRKRLKLRGYEERSRVVRVKRKGVESDVIDTSADLARALRELKQ